MDVTSGRDVMDVMLQHIATFCMQMMMQMHLIFIRPNWLKRQELIRLSAVLRYGKKYFN
jgi:hypothetical protein